MKKTLIIILTVVATLITPPAFASNRVLSLDGDGDYVEVVDSESLNAINSQVTMEAWIKAARYTGDAPIVFKGDEFELGLSNRSYYLVLQQSGSIFLGSAASGEQTRTFLQSMYGLITLNTWYHVAGVVDTESGVMRILINGVEVARRDCGKDIYMSALPLWIGWSHEAVYSPFAGQMDEVRIWNVARTQEEIQATMHTTLSGKEPGLVGYWRFDDPGSPTARKVDDAHIAEAELPKPGELVIPTVLSGLITNESGIPIQRASVRLEQNGEEIAQAETDQKGNYWIAISPPVGDLYDLSATSNELGSRRSGVRLREREQRIDLTLKEAISIEGTIMMLDDTTPHVAVPVQATVGEKLIDGVLTDGDGRYRLINLRPGQYNVRCYIPGGYVYYEGEKAGGRGSEEAGERGRGDILRVESGKTVRGIDFRFPQFKKGTWRHYNTSDGLASMMVNDIHQASDGTMWFGTGNPAIRAVGSGVSRYDGQGFVNFTTKDGLASNAVRSIYCDQDGVMWFGTWGGGVSRYDGQEFVNFTTEDGLAHNVVSSIYCDQDGVMWFGTSGGVSRYDARGMGDSAANSSRGMGDFPHFVNFTTENGLVGNAVNAIHGTPDGVLWFGTETGVSRYDARGMGDFPHFVNFTTENGLVDNIVMAICRDPDGAMWFVTPRGVSRYDGKEFVTFTTKDGLARNGVRSISCDQDGVMWFGTPGGVSRYDGLGFVNFTMKDGLMSPIVQAVCSGADGSLWFGTIAGGVSRYDDRTFTSLTEDDGLAGNWVRDIHRAPDGALWLATPRGVSRYDGKGFVNFTREHGLPGYWVNVIHRDDDGALWFGTEGGVSRYDGKGFVNFTRENGLADNEVYAIHGTTDGALWFGTNGGVSRYDGKKLADLTGEMGLDAYNVRTGCIHSTPDGVLWFGGVDGIRRYDGKELVNFTTGDGLVDNTVYDIHDDHDGVLWIATYGGVSRYDDRGMGDSPHFLNFTTEDGLAGNVVYTIYAEPDGTLWFATEVGVSGYDGFAWTSLGERDGLPHPLVVSIEQDSDGNFWFGTGSGLVYYRRSKTKPKARIVSVQTDKDYTKDIYSGLSRQVIPPITTGHRVTFGCRAIDFKTLPEKRQYRYRVYETGDVRQETSDRRYETSRRGDLDSTVSGLKSDVPYNPPTKETGFDWTPEKPGAYVFQVQAIDRDLNYSEPVSVTLKVVSPFYMRAGFLVPTVGFGAILIALVIIVSIGYARRHRQVQAYHRLAVEELQDAHEMQMSLLPEVAPPVEGMEIAGRSIPANTVGGDFFDYLSLPDGKVGIAIADVSGKGLRAAMNAVLASGMLYEVVKTEMSCGNILSVMNAGLYPRTEKQTFTAFSFAILDEDAGVIHWSSAAQPLPLIKRSDGVSEAEEDGELPLSIAPDVKYPDCELRLQTGDTIIFYTDGIIEAENEAEEMYGTERLMNLMADIDSAASAEDVIQAILQDVSRFVGHAEQYDDMTVVVIRKL